MKIINYYIDETGQRNDMYGFAFDTEEKTYRNFKLEGKEWCDSVISKRTGENICTRKENFRINCDLTYHLPNKAQFEGKIQTIQMLGFTEDEQMALDLGCCSR